ncbi:MAG: hypothetical protein ACLU37_10675 [Collinsella sp.]
MAPRLLPRAPTSVAAGTQQLNGATPALANGASQLNNGRRSSRQVLLALLAA